MQPQGHHQDGSGVQKHSAGGIYPYVLGVREREVTFGWGADGPVKYKKLSWFLIGGHLVDDLPCASYDAAVAAAQAFNKLRAEHAAEKKAMEIKYQVRHGVAAAFDRIGQHNQREWSRFQYQRNSQ